MKRHTCCERSHRVAAFTRPQPLLQRILAGLLVMAMAGVGCTGSGASADKKTGAVAGTVQLDGKPLKNVTIAFEGIDDWGGASTPVTDGTYQFAEPLPIGEYTVIVHGPVLSPTAARVTPQTSDAALIPRRYQTPVKSGLLATVKEGDNKFDFNLKR